MKRTPNSLVLLLVLFCSAGVSAEPDRGPGVGDPPRPFMELLREERSQRVLSSGTVGRSPLDVVPPGYYDLSVAGDVEIGGAIFRNGYPFIHQDGGVYNTAVGTDALISLTTGYYNVAFGYRALRDTTSGFGNTAVGGVSLLKNTTGYGNTAMGDMTLRENLDGMYNTAIGRYALVTNTSGNDNTAIGQSALLYNTTSSGNTAIGVGALRDNTSGSGQQTVVGFRAAFGNYGYDNTVVGAKALYGSTSAYRNVAIGSQALYAVVDGFENIAIGRRAGYNLGGISNRNILIGNEGPIAVESRTMRLGEIQTRTFIAGIRGVTPDQGDGIAVFIDSDGQLGTAMSSLRYKEDVHDMGAASEPLRELRPVTFRFKRPSADGDKPQQFGLIAEEVAEAFPELVVYDDQGRPESVKYHLLSVLLLNELQEQERANADRDRRLAELESRIARLQGGTAR